MRMTNFTVATAASNTPGAPAPATKAHMKQALFAIALGVIAGLVFGAYF